MDRRYAIMISLLLIVSSIGIIFYAFYSVPYVKVMDMSLSVRDNIGFTTDADNLNFGVVPAGGSIEKRVRISYDQDAMVQIRMRGNITRFVEVKNNIPLPANRVIEVPFVARVPEDTSKGDYEGRVTIYLRKVKD